MRNYFLFLFKFFSERNVGAIAPSSVFLAKEMSHNVKGKTLEVGAGTGALTKELIKKKFDVFYILEPNVDFFDKIKMFNKKNIKVLNIGVEDLEEKEFDHIVCSIPFNNLPEKVSFGIFKKIEEQMAEDAELVFFEYLGVSRIKNNKLLKAIKNKSSHKIIYKNIPPAKVIRINKKNLKMVISGIN